MRVSFFLQNLGKGGAQRHTLDLADSLGPAFRTSFVLQERTSGDQPTQAEVVHCDEPGGGPLRRWKKLSGELRTIASSEPDLLVCVNQICCIVACLGKLTGRIRCPVVGIFHSTTIGSLAGWLRTVPFLLLAPLLDCVVFVSANQAKAWSTLLRPRSSRVIVNGIRLRPDSHAAPRNRPRRMTEDSDLVIGSIAMFRREKNHLQQLEALRALANRGLKAKLLLVGGGPLLAEIQERAHEMGLSGSTIFAGEQRDVKPFIEQMDIGINTSTSIETLSLAALECMAQGVPMVMSDVGGAREIVTHGADGYLFQAGDTDALVSSLETLARDAATRVQFGAKAAAKVQQQFTHCRMVQQYSELFQSLAGRRS